jgi:hypothetical protein
MTASKDWIAALVLLARNDVSCHREHPKRMRGDPVNSKAQLRQAHKRLFVEKPSFTKMRAVLKTKNGRCEGSFEKESVAIQTAVFLGDKGYYEWRKILRLEKEKSPLFLPLGALVELRQRTDKVIKPLIGGNQSPQQRETKRGCQ